MLVDHLQRIPEFRSIEPPELRALAAHSRVLCVPANRWLIRAGVHLARHFYLLRGVVETRDPDAVVKASRKELRHFYPGCLDAQTRTSSQVLCMDSKRRDFLLGEQLERATPELVPIWLERFLTSAMMGQLCVGDWQDVIHAFSPREFQANERIVNRGDRAQECYVVVRGRALVHRGSEPLAELSAGSFFGEDGLILGGRRQADVTALGPVTLQCIPAGVFRERILERVVQFVCSRGAFRGILLNVGTGAMRGAMPVTLATLRERLADFDRHIEYLAAGGSRSERALAAFLLAQSGLRARALED